MTLEKLMEEAKKFLSGPENFVAAEDALRPELAGMRIYEEPIFGVAAADDPLFLELRRPEVVHPEEMLPCDWVPGAKSVVSFFLPFTEQVVNSNAQGAAVSDEWLHARIEGQLAMNALGARLRKLIEDAGFAAAFPTTDARFKNARAIRLELVGAPRRIRLRPRHIRASRRGSSRSAAWRDASEASSRRRSSRRRRGSTATRLNTAQNAGACQFRCPAKAIDKSRGAALAKDQKLCGDYLNATTRPGRTAPNARVRYGCGKCQVRVPCSRRIPNAAKKVKKIVTGGPRGRLYI